MKKNSSVLLALTAAAMLTGACGSSSNVQGNSVQSNGTRQKSYSLHPLQNGQTATQPMRTLHISTTNTSVETSTETVSSSTSSSSTNSSSANSSGSASVKGSKKASTTK